MPNEKTDKQGFSTNQPDKDRTLASQGGPSTGLGNATNRTSASPAEDTQTRLASLSAQKKKEEQTGHEESNDITEDEVRGMEDQTP